MSISVVSRVSNYGNGFASTIATPAESHAASTLLVVGLGFGNDPGDTPSPSVSDTAGDTFTPIGTTLVPFTNYHIRQYYTITTGHGSNVVTGAFGNVFGGQNRAISVYEISGTGLTLDDDAGATGAHPPLSTGTINITAVEAIIVAFGFCPFFGAVTGGAGYTFTAFGTGDLYGDEYKIVSASEAATMGSADSSWAIAGAAFKETGGAAGQPTMRRWGGVPHMGGLNIGKGHSGRMWGRTRSGLIVPRRFQEAA